MIRSRFGLSGTDYWPFLNAGVPIGGMHSGRAVMVKSPEQRDLFGGTPNANIDPCYHLACDTVSPRVPTSKASPSPLC